MRCLARFWKRVDWKKLKLAVLTGLGIGFLLLLLVVPKEKQASSLEQVNLAESFTQVAELLHSSGGTLQQSQVIVPESENEQLDPSQFLDESMEMLTQAVRSGDGGPVVALEGGEKVRFTINPDLQEAVEAEYQRYQPEGAGFVALNPSTGEVLALAGFSRGQTAPHLALMAESPAASVFKIVTAAALLEKHRVSPAKQVCYHGGARWIPKELLTPDPMRDTTCISVSQAMGRSTNVVFARLAYRLLSRSDLVTYAQRFGFNKVIPFPWPIELSRAEVPKDKVEIARMAAGFYHSSMSPMHGALIAAAVANGGIMPVPQIIKEVTQANGEVVFSASPRNLGRTIDKETANSLISMMLTTTTEGTAAKYFKHRSKALAGVEIAGKTGSLSKTVDGKRLYYSWFIGFAPASNPKIAFASLVVNGPKWKVKGPYIARKALERFFRHADNKLTAGR